MKTSDGFKFKKGNKYYFVNLNTLTIETFLCKNINAPYKKKYKRLNYIEADIPVCYSYLLWQNWIRGTTYHKKENAEKRLKRFIKEKIRANEKEIICLKNRMELIKNNDG